VRWSSVCAEIMATLNLIMSRTNSREMRKEAIGPFDLVFIGVLSEQEKRGGDRGPTMDPRSDGQRISAAVLNMTIPRSSSGV